MNIVHDLQIRYNDLISRYNDLLLRYPNIKAIEKSQLVIVRDEQAQIIIALTKLKATLEETSHLDESYLTKDVFECMICDDWECPICFKKKKDVSLMRTLCGHVFCDDCIMQLKKIGPSSCPMCRTSFFIDN